MRRAASGVGMCPSASQHDGTYRPLLDRMSRLGNESRSTFVAKANVLQLTDDAVVYVSSEQEGHPLCWHCPFSRRPQEQNPY